MKNVIPSLHLHETGIQCYDSSLKSFNIGHMTVYEMTGGVYALFGSFIPFFNLNVLTYYNFEWLKRKP